MDRLKMANNSSKNGSCGSSNNNNNHGHQRSGCQWTNERHSSFLSLMEATFVRNMFERSSIINTNNNVHSQNTNTRLDRYVPDIAESTLDLKTRKTTTTSVRVSDPVTRREKPLAHPYKATHDQVVPQLEAWAGDKGAKGHKNRK